MSFQKLNIESQKVLEKLSNSSHDDFSTVLVSHLELVEGLNTTMPNIPPNLEWLNISEPLTFDGYLRGKVLLLDFFTYCCINCMHVLPSLHRLEEGLSIADGLAVLGIHSAKFPNEKLTSNILSAILRYNITHPVLNDPDAILWNQMDIQCWPTFVFVSPERKVILYMVGEAHIDKLERISRIILKFYQDRGLIKSHPFPIKLAKDTLPSQSLLFPGKLCTIDNDSKLVISDTGHHHILIVDMSGVVEFIVGGDIGNRDGNFEQAQFNSPQGVCYHDGRIYLADTENHTIREINLSEKKVKTLAGTGKQGEDKEGGKYGTEQEISSPWDVVVGKAPGATESNNCVLYIAMAGTHQLWSYFLEDGPWLKGGSQKASCCLRFSGSGNEENRNNSYPHKASFAQPSGLSFGEVKNQLVLFVADSESSSIRTVELKSGGVKACVGGDRDPMNLFAYGDEDGKGVNAKLQHPLAVAWNSKDKRLYLTDSYNHKIKVVDPSTSICETLCGTGKAGLKDGDFSEALFNEPGGLCCSADGKTLFVADTNNHVIRVLDLEKRTVSTLSVLALDQVDTSLDISPKAAKLSKSIVPRGAPVKIFPTQTVGNHAVTNLSVQLLLPANCHFTEGAPSRWRVVLKEEMSGFEILPEQGTLTDDCSVIKATLKRREFSSQLCSLQVEAAVFFCANDSSICLVQNVILEQEISFTDKPGATDLISILYKFSMP